MLINNGRSNICEENCYYNVFENKKCFKFGANGVYFITVQLVTANTRLKKRYATFIQKKNIVYFKYSFSVACTCTVSLYLCLARVHLLGHLLSMADTVASILICVHILTILCLWLNGREANCMKGKLKDARCCQIVPAFGR